MSTRRNKMKRINEQNKKLMKYSTQNGIHFIYIHLLPTLHHDYNSTIAVLARLLFDRTMAINIFNQLG